MILTQRLKGAKNSSGMVMGVVPDTIGASQDDVKSKLEIGNVALQHAALPDR